MKQAQRHMKSRNTSTPDRGAISGEILWLRVVARNRGCGDNWKAIRIYAFCRHVEVGSQCSFAAPTEPFYNRQEGARLLEWTQG